MGQGTSSRHKTTDLGKSESTLAFEPGRKLISPSQQSFERSADRSTIERGIHNFAMFTITTLLHNSYHEYGYSGIVMVIKFHILQDVVGDD